MRTTEVWDLPEAQLKNSSTWLRYINEFGNCTRCKEHSGLLDYCCRGMFYFEGGTIDSDDLWQDIESELEEYAKDRAEDCNDIDTP